MAKSGGACTGGGFEPPREGLGGSEPMLLGNDGLPLAIEPTTDINALIETEIIPRLLLLHGERGGWPQFRQGLDRKANAADVEKLTGLVLGEDGEAASAFIDSMLREGAQLEDLLTNLLAPAARRLGELWLSDEADFLAVTSAVCGLQQLLHKLAPPEKKASIDNGLQALLLPTPGEQHSFGLLIVSELFRRDGWSVTSNTDSTQISIDKIVARTPLAVVGFSLSAPGLIGNLASAIESVRRNTCNPAVQVMVGGCAFVEQPELASKAGADFATTDVSDALAHARRIAAANRLRPPA